MANANEPLDLVTFFGVAESVSTTRLVLYIPSKERTGKIIFQAPWIARGMHLLTKMGGGATRLPPAEGMWKDIEAEESKEETITIIYSYVRREKFFEHLGELREFLHSMGKETKQGEVVFELSDRLYKIREFLS